MPQDLPRDFAGEGRLCVNLISKQSGPPPVHHRSSLHLVSSSSSTVPKLSRYNTVKMARRPARCYRYCKNKVSIPGQMRHINWFRHSHIQSLDSTVVYLIQKSESSILDEREQMSTNSHYAFTWFPTNTNNFHQKLLKLLEFAPTSTSLTGLQMACSNGETGISSKSLVKKGSISESELIHITSSESTRCCHVPVPIDFKLEWEVLGENQLAQSLESTLVKSCFQFEQEILTVQLPLRLSDDQCTSSQVDKRSSLAKTGASHHFEETSTSSWRQKERSWLMVPMFNSWETRDQSRTTWSDSHLLSKLKHREWLNRRPVKSSRLDIVLENMKDSNTTPRRWSIEWMQRSSCSHD